MAIIHRAELTPSKNEILHGLLTARGWLEPGEFTVLGAYRFDDPAGQVGIECHLVRSGEIVFHLVLSYRDAPLEDEDADLVATMEHSVLGTRYIYDGLEDEVALDCFLRAIAGAQDQADLDVYENGELVEHRPQSIRLRREVDAGVEVPSVEQLEGGAPFVIAQSIGGVDGTVRLVAEWSDGSGVVAAFEVAD
ncbi:hypothetical protein DEO23_10975 [Brachybacterium endophyticum]|uniref:Maltokinase N-terminal cap domain-containing protein n=1 Tax=Brachybacterium endophyticum TaxID=2182385 RepID=A0A2U2RIW6_9MICO|nr:hypothetical protein [Brachybacterium endophyticum]PWH05725.1 hypothetical protein DEO23_10975 [Brachybacterium endophyticum]